MVFNIWAKVTQVNVSFSPNLNNLKKKNTYLRLALLFIMLKCSVVHVQSETNTGLIVF